MELKSVFSRLETQLKFKSQGHADPSPSSVSSFWSADAFLRLSARSAFNTRSEVTVGQCHRISARNLLLSSSSLLLFHLSYCEVGQYDGVYSVTVCTCQLLETFCFIGRCICVSWLYIGHINYVIETQWAAEQTEKGVCQYDDYVMWGIL